MRESFIQKAFNNIEIWRKLFIFNVAIICFVILVAAAALYNEYRDNQNDYQLVEQTIRNNYDSVLYIRWCKHSECRRIFLADTFIFNRYLGCYPFYRIAAQKHPFADVYSSDFNIFEWGAEWIVA